MRLHGFRRKFYCAVRFFSLEFEDVTMEKTPIRAEFLMGESRFWALPAGSSAGTVLHLWICFSSPRTAIFVNVCC